MSNARIGWIPGKYQAVFSDIFPGMANMLRRSEVRFTDLNFFTGFPRVLNHDNSIELRRDNVPVFTRVK